MTKTATNQPETDTLGMSPKSDFVVDVEFGGVPDDGHGHADFIAFVRFIRDAGWMAFVDFVEVGHLGEGRAYRVRLYDDGAETPDLTVLSGAFGMYHSDGSEDLFEIILKDAGLDDV